MAQLRRTFIEKANRAGLDAANGEIPNRLWYENQSRQQESITNACIDVEKRRDKIPKEQRRVPAAMPQIYEKFGQQEKLIETARWMRETTFAQRERECLAAITQINCESTGEATTQDFVAQIYRQELGDSNVSVAAFKVFLDGRSLYATTMNERGEITLRPTGMVISEILDWKTCVKVPWLKEGIGHRISLKGHKYFQQLTQSHQPKRRMD